MPLFRLQTLQCFEVLMDFFPLSADFACMEPLGMESWEITSEQITASSQYNPSWSPERSRLNYPENGWTPSDDNVKEWIQVSGSSLTSARVNNGRSHTAHLRVWAQLLVFAGVSALLLGCGDAAPIRPEYCSTHLFDFFANHVGLAERKSNMPPCNIKVMFFYSLDSVFSVLFVFFVKCDTTENSAWQGGRSL